MSAAQLSLPAESGWRCHAKPAALGGRTCGHINARGIDGGRVAGGPRLLCCEACGATKFASDNRARRAGVEP